jgi:broad specificity phosphatase PhoE
MRILLIRHGNTDLLGRVLYGRMPGVHLNGEGCGQAQALGEALKARYRLDEVISSPLERALETASFIARPQALEISVDEGFNEIDFGSWMGKSFAELFETPEWKTYNRFRSTACPPGGEFLMQVQIRAWSSIESILVRYKTEDAVIAVVTHGDVIRALLLLFLGMPNDHIHRLEASPASVSEIVLGMGHPRVLTVNQIFR